MKAMKTYMNKSVVESANELQRGTSEITLQGHPHLPKQVWPLLTRNAWHLPGANLPSDYQSLSRSIPRLKIRKLHRRRQLSRGALRNWQSLKKRSASLWPNMVNVSLAGEFQGIGKMVFHSFKSEIASKLL
jgi:hypothetical protein